MNIIVSKFGGTSLADANQIKKVIAIVKSNPRRQCVVVSAPGKQHSNDQKITDLLYEWYRHCKLGLSSVQICRIIATRFIEIAKELGVDVDIFSELRRIDTNLSLRASADYLASRGEYLNGKIIAKALGFEFVDPADCIRFDEFGNYIKDDELLRKAIGDKHVVIPGFYGADVKGFIKTFSRGGSDVTGAIVARALHADLYENWTDVSGLLMADPRVVKDPHRIDSVTYRELRELAYMGANVFHEEAMFPVQEADITTNIRNTNEPDNPGTLIVAEVDRVKDPGAIVGIAGRKEFTSITVTKAMMNKEIGLPRRILTILEANGVSFDHMPGGIDTVSIIIGDKQLDGKRDKVVREIQEECSPDSIEVLTGMAMVAIVVRDLAYSPGVTAKIFTALAAEGIGTRMISHGTSGVSIIIGVDNDDYEKVVQTIYGAFVK